ncbi:MAG: pilus assembly protein N-terminal domain-containing protein, partial [Methylocella sp.]
MASLSITAGIGAVHAQEKAEARFNGAVAPRRISMGVGKSVIIDLPQDAAEIFVAEPTVANAVVRSPRKLYVIGVGTGQTSVFALDKQGRQIANLDLSIGRGDPSQLQVILRAAMPTAAITARSVNDTIILTGAVDSIEDAQRAGDIANGFVQRLYGAGPSGAAAAGGPAGGPACGQAGITNGSVVNALTIRGRDQVMLKVTVAEVARSIIKQMGIDLTANLNYGTSVVKFSNTNPFTVTGQPLIAGNAVTSSFGAAPSVQATLRAMESAGVIRTLAEPNLTAISGEAATFIAGGEFPIPTGVTCQTTASGSVGQCSPSVAFKKFGISLNFTPVVLTEGRISLHVMTEVSEVSN